MIADFGDSDCPWRTNGEGADIVRYSIVDFADMLVQTVEKIDVPDVRWFVKAFARYLLTNGADTRAGRKRKLYELLRSPENVTAAACISEAYADLVERNWQRFVLSVTDACRDRYKFEVDCDTYVVSPENPEKFTLRFLFTVSTKWGLSLPANPTSAERQKAFAGECASQTADSLPMSRNLRKVCQT